MSEHIRKAGLDVDFVSNLATPPESATESLQNIDLVSMEWFTKSSELQNWKKGGSDGSLLWLHGHPKDGKTFTMSHVLSNLCHYFDYGRQRDAVAVFCTREYSEASLVASLVFQLVNNNLRADVALKGVASWPTSLTEDDLTKRLWKILDACIREVKAREAVFLIDGIDKLESTAGSSFLMNLVALHGSTQTCATNRVLISSRDYPHIRDVLSKFESIERGKEMRGKNFHPKWSICLLTLHRMSQDALL